MQREEPPSPPIAVCVHIHKEATTCLAPAFDLTSSVCPPETDLLSAVYSLQSAVSFLPFIPLFSMSTAYTDLPYTNTFPGIAFVS